MKRGSLSDLARLPWRVIAAGSFVVLLFAAVLSAPFDLHAPFIFGRNADSETYTRLDFFGHYTRLWAAPLLFKIAPTDQWRVFAQTLISAASWVFLAYELSRPANRRLWSRVIFGGVLLLALSVQVTQWNAMILSESLSISLTVLLVAAWIRFLRARSWRRLAFLLAVTLLWACSKQLHAMISGLLLLPFAALLIARPRERRIHAAGLAILAVIVGYAMTLAAVTAQNLQAFSSWEVVYERILPDPSALTFFESHGMPTPTSAELDRCCESTDLAFIKDTRMVDFVTGSRFHRAYYLWVLHHMDVFATAPVAHSGEMLSVNPAFISVHRVLPAMMQSATWGESPDWIWLLAAELFLAGAALAVRLRSALPMFGFAIGFAYLWLAVTWLTESEQLPRLALPAAVLLRVLPLAALAALVADRSHAQAVDVHGCPR